MTHFIDSMGTAAVDDDSTVLFYTSHKENSAFILEKSNH